MKKIILIFIGMLFICSCYWNANKIDSQAAEVFNKYGFSIIAREGTQMSVSGGHIWYLLKKNDNQRGLYHAMLAYMFNGEIGLYNLESIDSVELNK